MNVLIIGSGGRESAIAWAVHKSPLVDNVYIAPGNAGTLKYGENILIDPIAPFTGLIDFVKDAGIDITIVGPEAPLTDGIADAFTKAGLPVFGPSQKASQLEGSKAYMKEFMARHSIPTARFKIFSDADSAIDYVNTQNRPFVVKTDGLAAGKGALVNFTVKDTLDSINRVLVKKEFGDAGKRIIVEDLLEGTEVSVFVVTDGQNFKWLASAQDHKRIFDNDEGPNTGGMGAYAPAPFIDESLKQIITNNIIKPTVDGMRMDGAPYRGIIYIGLMLTASGPSVIEYNVRLGDPEAQVVLPLLKTDFVEVARSVTENRLSELNVEYCDGYCTGIVLASKGYPGAYSKGFAITGDLQDDANSFVFHAGTAIKNGHPVTSGGRVLCVSARGKTLQESIDRAYEKADGVKFEGAYYRQDIGAKGLKHFEK